MADPENQPVCRLCGSRALSVPYQGKIRSGAFGQYLDHEVALAGCGQCGIVYLPEEMMAVDEGYYETAAYRDSVGENDDPDQFHQIHDWIAQSYASMIDLPDLWGKTVADIGCGAGSFLDSLRGFCRRSIAVEPAEPFHGHLAAKGHEVFSYAAEAARANPGAVDMAFSLDVIEHVQDPIGFLKDISQLLAGDGRIFLATPNLNHILLKAIPEVFASFFFRKAHLWYFSEKSLRYVLETAGFKDVQILGKQLYGFSNFICWLTQGRPRGELRLEYVSDSLDRLWRWEMEKELLCDVLVARARVS